MTRQVTVLSPPVNDHTCIRRPPPPAPANQRPARCLLAPPGLGGSPRLSPRDSLLISVFSPPLSLSHSLFSLASPSLSLTSSCLSYSSPLFIPSPLLYPHPIDDRVVGLRACGLFVQRPRSPALLSTPPPPVCFWQFENTLLNTRGAEENITKRRLSSGHSFAFFLRSHFITVHGVPSTLGRLAVGINHTLADLPVARV